MDPCKTVNRIKWKPPSENSIDFKLSLRFPPSAEDPAYPDLTAKPLFLLNVFRGGRGGMESSYVFHDRMIVLDEEWERSVLPPRFQSRLFVLFPDAYTLTG
jgi:mRNA guanylyltransferase